MTRALLPAASCERESDAATGGESGERVPRTLRMAASRGENDSDAAVGGESGRE